MAAQLVKSVKGMLKWVRKSDRDKPLTHVPGGHSLEEEIGTYKTESVRGDAYEIPVWVESSVRHSPLPAYKFVAGGGLRHKRSGRGGEVVPTSIFIRLSLFSTAEEMEAGLGRLEKEAYSVLIHEMTHARDLLIMGAADIDRSPESYYNLDKEVRAFMQQVVDEVEESFLEGISSGDPSRLRTARGIEILLRQSHTWKRIVDGGMDRSNQRLIRQAVARRVSDLWEEKFSVRTARRPIPVDKQQVAKLSKAVIKTLEEKFSLVNPKHRDVPIRNVKYLQNWGKYVGVLTTTSVDGNPINVPVWVEMGVGKTSLSGPRQYVGGGRVRSRTYKPGGRMSPIQVAVYIDSNHTVEEVERNLMRVEREVNSVLLHEATHVRDILRHEPEGDSEQAIAPALYYNKPVEIRAFMQQVVAEIEPQFRLALRGARRELRSDPEWGAGMIWELKSTGSIERLLSKSETWGRIRHGGMSKKNQRLILQAVARKVSDLWDEHAAKLVEDSPRSLKYRLPRAATMLPRHLIASRVAGLHIASVRGLVQKLENDYNVSLFMEEPFGATEHDPAIVVLNRIVVHEDLRGIGIGSRVMKEIVNYADKHGYILATTPSSDFGGSKSRLKEFYSNFGFIPNKGAWKDFRIRETMLRYPASMKMAAERSDKEKDEIYSDWKKLINMSKDALEKWSEDPERLKASLNRSEADSQGDIQSGYDSLHRIKRRVSKPRSEWTSEDYDNAAQENGFNSRMLGNDPGDPVSGTGKSKWEISLRNWGHDPSLSSSPAYGKWRRWKDSHKEEIKKSLEKAKKDD